MDGVIIHIIVTWTAMSIYKIYIYIIKIIILLTTLYIYIVLPHERDKSLNLYIWLIECDLSG